MTHAQTHTFDRCVHSVLGNFDIAKISYRLEYGISNKTTSGSDKNVKPKLTNGLGDSWEEGQECTCTIVAPFSDGESVLHLKQTFKG